MNRTDRMYALVEHLRALSPRPASARRLAERFEVSVRTIERDLSALQQSGVPIWAEQGRRGGYVLDPQATLPPVNFTPAEATALAVALTRAPGGPFAEAARSALHKVLAAMPARDAAATRALAGRVLLVEVPQTSPAADATAAQLPRLPPELTAALARGRCLEIDYRDRVGGSTTRVVEPLLLVGGPRGWYVFGWCRLRDAARAFRLDRIAALRLRVEPVVHRDAQELLPALPHLELRTVYAG